MNVKNIYILLLLSFSATSAPTASITINQGQIAVIKSVDNIDPDDDSLEFIMKIRSDECGGYLKEEVIGTRATGVTASNIVDNDIFNSVSNAIGSYSQAHRDAIRNKLNNVTFDTAELSGCTTPPTNNILPTGDYNISIISKETQSGSGSKQTVNISAGMIRIN